MKKSPTFYTGILTVLAGGVGMLLHFCARQQAFDQKGLLISGHPSITLLYIVTALALGLGVWAFYSYKNSPVTFPRNSGRILSAVTAGILVLLLSLRKLNADMNRISLIGSLVGLGAVLCLVIDGVRYYRKKLSGGLFYGAVSLFLVFHTLGQNQTWGIFNQPAWSFFPIMASVFLSLAAFYRANLAVGAEDLRKYLFFRHGAVFFCLAALPHDPLFYGLFALSFLLSPLPVATPEMALPETVCFCLNKLQSAGFEAYVVGGCVRDSLLGIQPLDYDMCTNATPDQIAQVFSSYELTRNGEKHGTIGVVIDHKLYEITTFRTEGGYADSRHPDWVAFVDSLETDLARRDFTVNAMAYTPEKGYIDPFGGKQDLHDRILRTVGNPEDRFTEDALRILRGVRFAVRFHLEPEEKTLQAMFSLAGNMESLARERIFQELQGLLPLITAQDLLRYAPIFTQIIPELAPTVDFQQNSPHHTYDVYRHTTYVVEAVPGDLALRFAALLHDIGKPQTYTQDEKGVGHFYGHAAVGANMADQILLRLKTPTQLRQQVVTLIENHMTELLPEKKFLKKRLARFGEGTLKQIIDLQEADFCSKGVEEDPANFREIRCVLEEVLSENCCLSIKDLAIDGKDLMELGVQPGPEMGKILEKLLEMVLEETLENEKTALLAATKNLGGTL